MSTHFVSFFHSHPPSSLASFVIIDRPDAESGVLALHRGRTTAFVEVCVCRRIVHTHLDCGAGVWGSCRLVGSEEQ